MISRNDAIKAFRKFLEREVQRTGFYLGETAKKVPSHWRFQEHISATYGRNGNFLSAEINRADNKKGYGFFIRNFHDPVVSFGPNKLTPGELRRFPVRGFLET